MELPRKPRKFIVSGLPSDAHTWNLVFLELLLEEQGYGVVNLGSCVPVEQLVAQCIEHRPDALVLGSVNGHGHIEALDVIRAIRATPELGRLVVVIGGKLGVFGRDNARFVSELLLEGFDAVFTDDVSPEALPAYLACAALPRRRATRGGGNGAGHGAG